MILSENIEEIYFSLTKINEIKYLFSIIYDCFGLNVAVTQYYLHEAMWAVLPGSTYIHNRIC